MPWDCLWCVIVVFLIILTFYSGMSKQADTCICFAIILIVLSYEQSPITLKDRDSSTRILGSGGGSGVMYGLQTTR